MKKSAALVLLLASFAAAKECPKGSELYNNECVLDIQPESASAVKPSDEKPPKDKMPSYQREGVKLIDEPSAAFEDARQDREKAEADAQGKKAAGL